MKPKSILQRSRLLLELDALKTVCCKCMLIRQKLAGNLSLKQEQNRTRHESTGYYNCPCCHVVTYWWFIDHVALEQGIHTSAIYIFKPLSPTDCNMSCAITFFKKKNWRDAFWMGPYIFIQVNKREREREGGIKIKYGRHCLFNYPIWQAKVNYCHPIMLMSFDSYWLKNHMPVEHNRVLLSYKIH